MAWMSAEPSNQEIWIAVVSVVLSTLSGIFRTALYQFAAGEPTPAEFSHDDLAAVTRAAAAIAACFAPPVANSST